MPDACVIIPHSVRSELRAVLRATVAHGEGRPIGDHGNLDPDERCAITIPSVDFMRNHLARIVDEDEVGTSVVVEVGVSEAGGRIRGEFHEHREIGKRFGGLVIDREFHRTAEVLVDEHSAVGVPNDVRIFRISRDWSLGLGRLSDFHQLALDDRRFIGGKEIHCARDGEDGVAEQHLVSERGGIGRDVSLAVGNDGDGAIGVNHRAGGEGVGYRAGHFPPRHVDSLVIGVLDNDLIRRRKLAVLISVLDRESGRKRCNRTLGKRNAGVERAAVADLLGGVSYRVGVVKVDAALFDIIVPNIFHAVGYGHLVGRATPVPDFVARVVNRGLGAVERGIRHDRVGNRRSVLPKWRSFLGGARLLEDLVHQRAQTPQVEAAEFLGLPDGFDRAAAARFIGFQRLDADMVAAVERVRLERIVVGRNATATHAGNVVIVLTERQVHIVGERLPSTQSVDIVVGRKVRPNIVVFMGDAREGEIVDPRGEIEILDHDLGEGGRIGGRRGKISINPDLGGSGDFTDERGELGKILLVIVVRRLLLDRAGIGRGTVEVADILVGIAQGIVTVAIFDQLVGEALGVERELVEFAVPIEAHGIVERCARTVVVEELERKVLAQERGVGIFGGEGTLADFFHFRASHGVGASQGLGLVEAQTMRFLREPGARIAAQVDADIIVIKTGRRIVDAAARVVGNDRKVLLVGVHIHLRLAFRIDEKVQRLQGRGKLVGRRLDNRAIPFVAVVGIFERWRAEGAVCAVGNIRGEKDASAGGRDGRGGDGCGIDIAEQFVSRRGLAHGNFA